MRSVSLAAATLVATMMLAGCSDSPPAADAGEPKQSLIGLPVLRPTATDNLTRPLILLEGQAGPDQPLITFDWRVPEQALVTHPGFDDERVAVMQGIVLTNASVTQWHLGAVVVEDGQAEPVAFFSSVEGANRVIAPTGVAEEPFAPTVEPFFFMLGNLDIGDRVVLVLAAEAATAGNFSVVLGPVASYPGQDDDPVDSLAQLAGNQTITSLPVLHVGTGMQSAVYFSVSGPLIAAWYGGALEVEAGPIVVEDAIPADLRPAANARDVTLSAAFDQPGYSLAVGGGIGFGGANAGVWEANADLHGVTVDAQSVVAPLQASTATGLPIFFAIGDGEGAATSSFRLASADATLIHLLLLQQFDFGSTMSQMTGANETDTGAFTFTGALGNIPPTAAIEHGALVLRHEAMPLLQFAMPAPDADAAARGPAA